MNFSPVNITDSSVFSLVADNMEEMSLSDLEQPPPRAQRAGGAAPSRASRFTLLANKRVRNKDMHEGDQSAVISSPVEEADEEIEQQPEPSEDAGQLTDTRVSTSGPPIGSTSGVIGLSDPSNNTVLESTPAFITPSAEPHDVSLAPQSLEDRMHQQLFQLQRLNESFDMYHTCLSHIQDQQEVGAIISFPQSRD